MSKSSSPLRKELERAWHWRESRGHFARSQAVRVFYGPGESGAQRALAEIAIDRFGNFAWVTDWARAPDAVMCEVSDFLAAQGLAGSVVLRRPEKGLPEAPETLFGQPDEKRFTVNEGGRRYRIQLLGARHPGLFLDHVWLRDWLQARAMGWNVLNTFAYTGSLSVAAGIGQAAHVTTLDLSKPTMKWAEENWAANDLPAARARFIAGDVFEWLPRLKREKQAYDCVILDPPSFSRGNKTSFSTAKDLRHLHELALELLAPGGIMATSINSANVSRAKFEADLFAAANAKRRRLEVLEEISQPDTFPSRLGDPHGRYLKGWVVRAD